VRRGCRSRTPPIDVVLPALGAMLAPGQLAALGGGRRPRGTLAATALSFRFRAHVGSRWV